MRYEAVINAYDFEELPERIRLEKGVIFTIEKAKVIINEVDNSKDLFPSEIEKGYSVALKLDGLRRNIKKTDELKFSVTQEEDQYGEFMYLGEDAKLKDVLDAVNSLVQNVKAKSV